ncbi:MAG: pyruvate kinase [SAR324 cluster bacterium]|nr:pyruvate kinase [SAR324 cluster bacterium]
MINKTRFTKIISTVGPSCQTPKVLRNMLLAGTNIFRLNFSHANHDTHLKSIKSIRAIAKSLKREVAILGDLQGPKIRLAVLDKEISVAKGDKITITTDPSRTNASTVATSYKQFAKDVKRGDKILIDDGFIELKAIKIVNEFDVLCEVFNSGILKSCKGINLPDSNLSINSFAKKDLVDLKFIIEQDLDFVALSFVRSADDIKEFTKIMTELNGEIPIIAKIEKPESIKNIDSIIDISYGVMVARGDLGVEIPAELVPFEQKRIVKLCNRKGRPVIIATQILESMITKVVPTRAEANDIANAVLDGADALMLSAETAVGLDPVNVLTTMSRIIKTAEDRSMNENWYGRHPVNDFYPIYTSDAVCYSAVRMAIDLKAKMISCVTKGGRSVFKLAKHRPPMPILAITDSTKTMRKLILSWGVCSTRIKKLDNSIKCLDGVIEMIDQQEILEKDDLSIFVVGLPDFASGSTNTIKAIVATKDKSVSFM